MIDLLSKRITFITLRIIGLFFLITYLLYYKDFSFSLVWALGYIALSFGIATLLVYSKIHEHFPILKYYYFYRTNLDKVLTENEYNNQKVNYLIDRFQHQAIFFTPLEDAVICIPILILGINPLSALIGGMAFGGLHLNSFNYFECIVKAIYYTLAIYFILPFGLLTIILGHFVADFMGFILLKLIKDQ